MLSGKGKGNVGPSSLNNNESLAVEWGGKNIGIKNGGSISGLWRGHYLNTWQQITSIKS